MVARHDLRTGGLFGLTSALLKRLRFFIVRKMKNIFPTLFSVLSLAVIFYSRLYSAMPDSTRQYVVKEVVVTSNRMPVTVEKLPSSVQVIDSLAMAQSNGISVADVVAHAAGVSLESYGGNGALQSVSLRGMGSDYSLILLDGQRYTTYEINTVDLGILSLMDVDRIEIASGGISSLYGADAIGGVVNIITKKPNGQIGASVAGSIGSFGIDR